MIHIIVYHTRNCTLTKHMDFITTYKRLANLKTYILDNSFAPHILLNCLRIKKLFANVVVFTQVMR